VSGGLVGLALIELVLVFTFVVLVFTFLVLVLTFLVLVFPFSTVLVFSSMLDVLVFLTPPLVVPLPKLTLPGRVVTTGRAFPADTVWVTVTVRTLYRRSKKKTDEGICRQGEMGSYLTELITTAKGLCGD